MLDPRAQEHEIASAAQSYTSRVRSHLAAIGNRVNVARTTQELAGTLNGLAVACQARPVAADVSLSGRIARMLDPGWWRRNLRRELCRENEEIVHAQGGVRRSRDCYVSEHAMRVKRERARRNAEILAGLEAVNEEGVAVSLADAAAASVSNPKLRRGELMVRCRGFEEMAAMLKHEAVFLTITCPSRFHRFDAGGKPNAKWSGQTPKDAQRYLRAVWAKIRAEWKRQGYAPYGFRVAEPHHDGCPHWHILLFAPGHHVGWFVPGRLVAGREDHGAGLVGVAGAYALEDQPGESGAVKHRFTCERIDTTKGSATGYIAKYISKNIDGEKEDGEAVGLDFASGKRATEGAKRVRTWASTWGIRQFQQVGGPSVTVYRELRRLARDEANPARQMELFEGVTAAADKALWAMFWFLQGGPDVPKSELSHRPMYIERDGRYGDASKRPFGVWANGGATDVPAFTRPHDWTVQRAGLAVVNATQLGWTTEMLTRQVHAQFAQLMEQHQADGFQRSGEAASTWTGVNNCTADDEAAAVRADYSRGVGGQSIGVDPPCTASDAPTWPETPPPRPLPAP